MVNRKVHNERSDWEGGWSRAEGGFVGFLCVRVCLWLNLELKEVLDLSVWKPSACGVAA